MTNLSIGTQDETELDNTKGANVVVFYGDLMVYFQIYLTIIVWKT